MRWGLFATRMFIVIVNIVIAAIIILSVVPLVQGGLDIRLPPDDPQWEYKDNVLSAQMPVAIYNGGYYDIQDFTLGFSIADNDSRVLVTSQTAPVDIVHGRWTTVPLAMVIDLSHVDPATVRLLVFHDASLNMSLDLQAKYTDRMVTLDLGGQQAMNWSALISNMAVNAADMTIEPNGTLYTITVPYHFDASNMISGTQLTVGATLRNSTAVLGTASQGLIVQPNNDGNFSLNVSPSIAQDLMTHPQTLYVDSNATFAGATFDRTNSFQWQPFISNVSMGSPYLSNDGPNQLTVPYHFETSSLVQGEPATVQVTISDASSTIASGNLAMMMQATNSGEFTMDLSPATYSRLLGSSEDWTISVQFDLMGVVVEEQQSYHWNGGGP